MKTKKLGFIGFGEAAYQISSGLIHEESQEIIAFDVSQDHPKLGQLIRNRAEELGVTLMSSLKELVLNSHIVVSAASAKYALTVAKEALPYLNSKHLFVDINAASPMVKEEISTLISGVSNFVDVAVVESIPKFKHKVPLLISGKGSSYFSEFGNKVGMDITIIDDKPGSASAIKMIRSIFMKGFTMLLIETLSAGEKFGVNDLIVESIDHSIRDKPLKDTADLLITRTATHAERRVSEMEEVIKTLDKLNVNSLLSKATEEKLRLLVETDLKKHFINNTPENFKEVLQQIDVAEKSLTK
ncbi:6-phosphogluconate dehydrogenase [Lentibacillus populi]|uniref:6-phosphogluconate dehydrogenase n=1 Tax=Lentibacillus populi TaxID=1827502 RepID=A0A9W5X6K0_9BACI|nr:NAD(P)-dependent oxidoreductase [Lentibacillus populi]GGB48247.1 6-phosphogluconate dehydrogenase [Lentibacillus populi]